MNVWTYYGDVQFSLTEKIELLDDNGEVLETISEVDGDSPSILHNPNDYAVILKETTDWVGDKERKFERHAQLYIYCPKSDDADENAKDERYSDVYNRLSGEDGSLSL